MRGRHEESWDSTAPMAAQTDDTTLPILSPDDECAASVAWPVDLDAHGATDPGLVRPRNEDEFLVAELDRQLLIRETSVEAIAPTRWRTRRQAALLAVADGMGGHAGGSMASQVVLDALAGYLLHDLPWPGGGEPPDPSTSEEAARLLLIACQERLTEVADRKGLLGGKPGTTLTAAYVAWPELTLLHVGDSRLYLLRDGEIRQLTSDHTVYSDPDQTQKRSETSPMRHVLTNAIVSGPGQAFGEIRRVHLDLDDRLLLCTDGLTEHVSDAELAEVLAEHDSVADAADELIERARTAGGSDNITAVVARFLARM